MTITQSRAKLANDPHTITRIESLLSSYPHVTADEAQEIAGFLRNGSCMDVGLLSTNRNAWAKAEQFRRENATEFATTAKEYALFAGTIIALLVLGVLLWSSQVGGG
jgi:hypothetical protein